MARHLEDFERTLSAASIDVGRLRLRDDGTVGSIDEETAPEVPESAALLTLSSRDEGSELMLGEVMGRGGIGIVREAVQTSLRRTVAVKTLREDSSSPQRQRQFIREARVTGILEHPNIVPVHALGRGADGRPLMVMKKVTGRPWRELIQETLGRPNHLETHLEILSATCRAVEFAHSRGILHRDLKPSNVLVGDFGEVTVLDWGLAAAIEEPVVEGLPLARELNKVVGTPRYMAPELASGNGPQMGVHTDVYLLGAILHEILTGKTRHEGDSLMAMLYNAYASRPVVYGPEVPRELGQIANRATHVEPEQRFASVAEFREALARYKRHESSRTLAEAALARLEAFAPGDEEGGRTTLTECRFAFQQALSLWPDNAEASAGLRRTLEYMVERAIGRSDLGTAENLLEEMEELPPEHEARLAALRRRVEARQARVRALEEQARQRDLGVTVERGRRFSLAFGVLFPLTNVVLGALEWMGWLELTHFAYVVTSGAVAAVVMAPALPRWKEMIPNRASRRLLTALATLLAMQAPIFLLTGRFGLDLHTSLSLSLYQLGGSIMVSSLMVRPHMAWTGAVAVLLGVLSTLLPALAYLCVALSYATFVVYGSLVPWQDSLLDEHDPRD